MTFHATENVTKDLPADFESDCLNCDWFLKHYEREDLFLFQSVFEGGWHIINRYKAEQKAHAFYEEHGGKPSLRAFHDKFLEQGSAPFWALRRLMLDSHHDSVLE